MASGLDVKTLSIIPLNGKNYPTWKVQCRMALMRDGVWGIVAKTEVSPGSEKPEDLAKFVARRDRALATIVLSVDPSLLYLLGDPQDPAVVWEKLANQFQKKTWANKLALRRKLYSLRLKDGESVQKHVKEMTEIFDELAVIDDPITEEDRVVHLLASLPESYDVLVTALEANVEVPKMETVTERLLHEERKLKVRSESETNDGMKAMLTNKQPKGKGPKCYRCGKFGHIKRNCRELSTLKPDGQKGDFKEHKAYNAADSRQVDSCSDSDEVGLMVNHAFSSLNGRTNVWIIDSGATCHMCNDANLFVKLHNLEKPEEVTLGDGHVVKATGRGVVKINIESPNTQKGKSCVLQDVLYVPSLSYNLVSVSKATKSGKTVKFNEEGCHILDESQKLIVIAKRIGNLYYLNCVNSHAANPTVGNSNVRSKEVTWHKRFGHLGVQNLQKLAKENLVDGYDYDKSKDIDFCESCMEGKHHRSKFPVNESGRAKEPLDLVHSDVCGKMSTKSLSGTEYFLTFIDDYTHYVWVYVLKHKDEVFSKFLEWKALVEKSSGKKVKVFRTDNGGEYTSTKFENYLKKEGITHQLTVPKTPEQNGVAERMNRTLVESVRSMLADAKLPHKFWAETLSTAVYLRNRSPTVAVKGKTPFEAWTGRKPNVKHLRVFGCEAYAHVPKDERKKLDSKARKCILLGYGAETKGYRLYDQKRARVFHSRDVQFNESSQETEVVKEQEPKQNTHVELDFPEFEKPIADEEPVVNEEPELQVPRRSDRDRRPPAYYGEWATAASYSQNEPRTVKEALSSPQKAKWVKAMEKEMESLKTNEVWDLVELPENRKAIGSKWVFRVKTDANGTVETHKARLVAQGFSQSFGDDYDETFSPVARFESVRTVIALAAQHGLKLHQMDVTTAFLNGDLEEEVYMKQPEGFIEKEKEHLVCRLRRSLYGLKQSPRCWNSVLDRKLKSMGFVQTIGDPCIYVKEENGDIFVIAVYVDDMILAGKSDEKINEVKQALSELFQMKDMGELHYFLGVKVIQKPELKEVWIGQEAYTKSVLERFGMDNSKPVNTPVNPRKKLKKAADDSPRVDQVNYQCAVGHLLYLSTKTRPDIAYAVSDVARFSADPTEEHWAAVKRIMRYLNGTRDMGLLYDGTGSKTTSCVGYSDADWAGDLDDRKSTSGYVFQISNAAVSWRSKKQPCVALSTAEAEYMALASATQEAVWLRQLLSDLKNKPTGPTLILEDNQAAICMAKNAQYHGRAKHIDIKYHFIREHVANAAVKLQYCRTEEMIADIFTKGLGAVQFVKLRKMLGVSSMKKNI